MHNNHELVIEVMISEQQIQQRISELAQQIDQHYQHGHQLLLIGLLKGSFIFMADLCRKISVPHAVDFMTVSSYGSATHSSRDVKIIKDLDEEIQGRDVLIVEDIVDSGHTLSKVCALLALRQPKSMQLCTLIEKPSRKEVDIAVQYIGFSIPNQFIVGYGLDYDQQYRHLPFIGLVKQPA